MTYDEQKTDEEKRKSRAQRGYQKNVDIAFKALLETPAGRDFMWWLLEESGIGRNPFTGDRNKTDFACGELNVGQKVLARLTEVSPDGYLILLKEKANGRTDRTDDSDGTGDSASYDEY